MTIKNKIKQLFFRGSEQTHVVPQYERTDKNAIEEKAYEVYGEDKLRRQQLYEKWSVKDFWLLKDEAIPLVLGFDPENGEFQSDPEMKKKAEELFQHAKHCIEQGLSLAVVDDSCDESQWQVKPTEFYCWASVSRVGIPQQLSALMEFVISSVKQSSFVSDRVNQESIAPEAASLSYDFNEERERILGTALALILKKPDECKNSKGRIQVRNIVEVLLDRKSDWLNHDELKMSQTAIEDLLNKWVNKA